MPFLPVPFLPVPFLPKIYAHTISLRESRLFIPAAGFPPSDKSASSSVPAPGCPTSMAPLTGNLGFFLPPSEKQVHFD